MLGGNDHARVYEGVLEVGIASEKLFFEEGRVLDIGVQGHIEREVRRHMSQMDFFDHCYGLCNSTEFNVHMRNDQEDGACGKVQLSSGIQGRRSINFIRAEFGDFFAAVLDHRCPSITVRAKEDGRKGSEQHIGISLETFMVKVEFIVDFL